MLKQMLWKHLMKSKIRCGNIPRICCKINQSPFLLDVLFIHLKSWFTCIALSFSRKRRQGVKIVDTGEEPWLGLHVARIPGSLGEYCWNLRKLWISLANNRREMGYNKSMWCSKHEVGLSNIPLEPMNIYEDRPMKDGR